MDVLAGCDFFTAEVLSWSGLVTYVLFFIESESGRVWIGGITRHPESCWMQQVARNATLEGEGYLKGCRYVLHDRDKKFCTDFCQTLAAGDVKCVVVWVVLGHNAVYITVAFVWLSFTDDGTMDEEEVACRDDRLLWLPTGGDAMFPHFRGQRAEANRGFRGDSVVLAEFGQVGDDGGVRCPKRRVPACILVCRYVSGDR